MYKKIKANILKTKNIATKIPKEPQYPYFLKIFNINIYYKYNNIIYNI